MQETSMNNAYFKVGQFASLVNKPVIIDEPGDYRTREGLVVEVHHASTRHDAQCRGAYPDGVKERWHKSGRIFTGQESINDIISKA